MSMIGNFRMSTDEEIRSLLDDPDRIEAVLYPDDESGIEATAEYDVDKAWHAIHFLLCGQPWEGTPPLDFIVSGGTPVGEVDVGYGPARVFSSAEVSEIVLALEPITAAELKGRFSVSAFRENDIYPDIWDEPQADCLDGYVLDYFDGLKRFLQGAQAAGKALIVYLN
jgi:hypothetical protein